MCVSACALEMILVIMFFEFVIHRKRNPLSLSIKFFSQAKWVLGSSSRIEFCLHIKETHWCVQYCIF